MPVEKMNLAKIHQLSKMGQLQIWNLSGKSVDLYQVKGGLYIVQFSINTGASWKKVLQVHP